MTKSNKTTLYVLGGIAAIGLLAYAMKDKDKTGSNYSGSNKPSPTNPNPPVQRGTGGYDIIFNDGVKDTDRKTCNGGKGKIYKCSNCGGYSMCVGGVGSDRWAYMI